MFVVALGQVRQVAANNLSAVIIPSILLGPDCPMVHHGILRTVSSDDIGANALAIFEACRGPWEGGGVSI